MKAFFAVLLIGLIAASQVDAQNSDLIRIRAGHTFREEFPNKLRFRYDQFQDGDVMLLNGISLTFRFNYDFLLEAMLTIRPKGDTVVIGDQKGFRYLSIKEDTFYHVGKDRYVEVIAGGKSVNLVRRETYILKRRDRKVSNGYFTFVDQTNSVTSTRNMGYGRMIYDQDILMKKAITYYLLDKTGKLHHATKSKFLRAFPEKKKSIENYLDKTVTDFKSKEDLIRLFAFCNL